MLIDYEFDLAGISSDATQIGPNLTVPNGPILTTQNFHSDAATSSLGLKMEHAREKYNKQTRHYLNFCSNSVLLGNKNKALDINFRFSSNPTTKLLGYRS